MSAPATIVRLAVYLAAAAALVTACGAGESSPAASPSPVAATATPAASESTPTPGDRPGGTPSPTPDPQNPFHFSGPPVDLNSLAGAPGLDTVAPDTDIAKILVQIPATRLLAPADLARFKLTAAEGRSNSNGFSSTTYYSDDVRRETVSVGAWNKVGDFNVVVPINSPVTNFQLTYIDGLPALTMLPSANVVGGAGPRTVYLYYAGVIYAIHTDGFVSDPDNSFMSLVHNFIGEVKK